MDQKSYLTTVAVNAVADLGEQVDLEFAMMAKHAKDAGASDEVLEILHKYRGRVEYEIDSTCAFIGTALE